MSIQKLLEGISEYSQELIKSKPESVKIVCHRGPDGIVGAVLLSKLFLNQDIDFCITPIKVLDHQAIIQLSIEPYKYYIFVGFGTESLDKIEKIFAKKEVYIFDHKTPGKNKSTKKVISPYFYGINSYTEITSSGLVYLFCKSIDPEFKKEAWLPAVTIFSEKQETKLSDTNSEILQTAIENKDIIRREGLKNLAFQNMPIHKALEYSTEPYLPGISANQEGAINFLNEQEISIKKESGYVKLEDLNNEDMKKLATNMTIKQMGSQDDNEDFFGTTYSLTEDFPVKDLKGFAILLRACGYLNNPSVAISLCMKDEIVYERAIGLLEQYVNEIVSALNWFYKNRKKDKIVEEENFVFFNSESEIKENTLSSVISIISRSNLYKPGFVIMGGCHTIDDKIKISLRVSKAEKSTINLLEILKSITKKIKNAEYGGHPKGAGAMIPVDSEKELEEVAVEILRKKSFEESVL